MLKCIEDIIYCQPVREETYTCRAKDRIPERSTSSAIFAMGLLTILKKIKRKEKEVRILILGAFLILRKVKSNDIIESN